MASRLVGWSSRFCSCKVGFLLLVCCSCQSSCSCKVVFLFLASFFFFSLLILARALDPMSERGDSAGKPRPFPQNPIRAVGRTTRATRGTSSRTTPEGLGVAVTKEGLDTQGKSRLPFILGSV